jgi:hypothetical protein
MNAGILYCTRALSILCLAVAYWLTRFSLASVDTGFAAFATPILILGALSYLLALRQLIPQVRATMVGMLTGVAVLALTSSYLALLDGGGVEQVFAALVWTPVAIVSWTVYDGSFFLGIILASGATAFGVAYGRATRAGWTTAGDGIERNRAG